MGPIFHFREISDMKFQRVRSSVIIAISRQKPRVCRLIAVGKAFSI